MSIRADILTQLADVLAELYHNQGSTETMAVTAGLNLARISFYPRAIDTWITLLKEAEVQSRTQIILERAKDEKPVYEPLQSACQSYDDWVAAGRPMAEPVRAPRRLLRAPPPPDTFAGRTVELQKLTETLLHSQAAAVSAAVPGMGGVGKTTLALKLASDLAPNFPGGVVWLEAGYGAGQPDLVDRLARTLGIDLATEPRVEKRAVILQSVLASRGRVFVILDDLWDIDLGRWAGKALLPADRVLLVTSRNVALCRAMCNHVRRLDVLPEGEALELLANLLGSLGRHTEIAKELTKLLDGHPLALEIAARRCENGVDDLPWVVHRLQANPTLGELRLPGQESRESSVEVSLALSYGDLDADLQKRFRALGVFAPAPFDLAGLAAVWEIESPAEAEGIAHQLVRTALLVIEHTTDDARPVYRQHMLLRAYAWALLEQAGELEAVAARHVLYYQVLPGDDAENWQAAEVFWGHIEQGWQHAWRAGPDTAVSYYYAISSFLYRRARHVAHIEWTSALLALPVAQISGKVRGVLLNNMGLVYDNLGDKPRALDLYEQALPLLRQVGDKAGEANALNNMGNVYSALGDKPRALELYEQALLLRRQVGDKAGEATTLNNMGLVFADLGDKPRALDLNEQALLLFRQMEDKAGEATTLNNMGLVFADLGDKPRALELYEQALPLRCQVGDKAGEAATLTNMGRVYSELGDKPRALALHEQALSLSRQVGDKAGEAATLHNMGIVYSDLGDKPRALELYEQALPLTRQVGNKAGEANALNNMGNVYSALGDKPRALELYEQALPLQRQVGNKAGEAITLHNMGSVYSDLGDKPRALALYGQALPLRHQVGDRAGEATTLNNIGLMYDALGEKQQALAYYEQSLPLFRQVGDRAGEARTLNNIGRVYDDLGEKQQALAYFEQSLPLRRQVGAKAGEATTLNNIGLVYSNLGEKHQALAYYEQALPLFRQVGDKAGEAATLTNIGSVYSALGEKPRALELYEQALPFSRQVGNKAGEAITLHNMGRVYSELGEKQQALAYFEQALPLRRQVGDRSGEAATLNDMGAMYAALGETQQALAYFGQALPLRRQVGDRSGEATTLNNMGAMYAALGEKQQALVYFEQALPLFRQVGDRSGEAIALAWLGHHSAGEENFTDALDYYAKSLDLLRQIGDRRTERQFCRTIAGIYRAMGDLNAAEGQLRQVVALDKAISHPDLESDRAVLEEVQAARRVQVADS